MPSAEIIAIGTELLLGEIQDTNTRYLARFLRDMGIDLFRTTIVGDNVERVAQVIRDSMGRAEIVITTGGVGPTVDDPTREAVARALDVQLEFRGELWEQILERFKRYGRTPTENNRKQAYIPEGAITVENPVGTAPSFIFDTEKSIIASLPGVPREMEYLLENAVAPFLRQRFNLRGIIKAYVLHTSGVGESQIDEWIGDLEKNANPTVGLLAHAGQVDIRITAKADSDEEADKMIKSMADEIYKRCGDTIYGVENDSLEAIAVKKLKPYAEKTVVVEYGLDGKFVQKLDGLLLDIEKKLVNPEPVDEQELKIVLNRLINNHGLECAIGVSLKQEQEKSWFKMVIFNKDGYKEIVRSYGGSPKNALVWAINMALDAIRRNF